ncbi:MAG TPA: DUF4905 domain-containing protein [Cytophagaceae bacterium]
MADTVNPIIALELRSGETREVEFAAIDVFVGNMLWKGNPASENWWPGLKQVINGLLIIQGYKEAQQPEPKGIWVLGAANGQLLWNNDSAVLMAGNAEELILQTSGEEKKYVKVDPHSGTIIEEIANGEHIPFIVPAKASVLPSGHYTSENIYFQRLAEFVKIITGLEPVKAIDYLEVNNYIIISFYIYNNGKLNNELLVSDQDGQILFRELIGEELSGVGLETFFVFNNRLVFIKNKKELMIYEL